MKRTEQKFSSLEIKSVKTVADNTKQYIIDRRNSKQRSLRVKSEKVNSCFMNGFDWNRIITVAGLSGSGKSTLVRQWIREMIENNQEEFEVLTFQFEMMGIDEIARDLSSKISKSVKEIYSATSKLDEKSVEEVSYLLDEIGNYPISIVDNHGTVEQIRSTIIDFVKAKEKNIVVTIDHTLLVKGNDEKETIDSLYQMLIETKKDIDSMGYKVMFIVISQLNRNIESIDRLSNAKFHYPNKTDLFGASSVYFSSDYVIVAHKPILLLEGISETYGPVKKGFKNGLPLFKDARPLIYLHVIKDRFGSNNKIIPFVDNLEFSSMNETSL
ncbi:MAG: DnaB-like helicase C-terminal domain-containing protein [Bacteroidota bacterium]|jgi:replicative DNA helicase